MIRVYINSKDKKNRFIVDAELLKTNEKTVLVKLPNGKIIERDILRDLPDGLIDKIIEKPKVIKQSWIDKIKCQIQKLTSGHWGGSPRI